MRRRYALPMILLAGGALFTGLNYQQAVHADERQYEMTLYWVEAKPRSGSPATDPKVASPIPAKEGDDLIAALNKADRRYRFRLVTALSVPFAREEKAASSVRASVPDGMISLRPISLEGKGVEGMAGVRTKLAFEVKDKSGASIKMPGNQADFQFNKAYSLAGTDAETHQVSVYASVSPVQPDTKTE